MASEILYALNMDIPPLKPGIDYHEGIVFTGSCFSDHIASRLKERYFSVFAQPNGVVFNPLSLADPFERILSGEDYKSDDLVSVNGYWFSRYHHGTFSETDKEDLLRKINHRLHELKRYLHAASHLFVTFGSAWVYRGKEDGILYANCHKLPASTFHKQLLNEEEISQKWCDLIAGLRAFNPALNIVLTVSPVKHLRDGVTENVRSKSVLISSAHRICEQSENTRYFPAFELVNEDLRDYRFYENDGAHPNQTAIDHVFERFKESCLSEVSLRYCKDVERYLQMQNHRIARNDGEEYIRFMKNLESAREELKSRYDVDI